MSAPVDAAGSGTASLPITRPDQGKWRVSSKYAGAGVYQPSSAGPCEIFVHVS